MGKLTFKSLAITLVTLVLLVILTLMYLADAIAFSDTMKAGLPLIIGALIALAREKGGTDE